MEWVRTSRDPWGQEVVLGASWDVLWLFVAAGVVIILAHALWKAVIEPRIAGRNRS